MMNISIIGCGYVGLVSGAGFARKGHSVVCVDSDPERVDRINAAEPPFYEEGLSELLADQAPRLRATKSMAEAIDGSELSLVCVGTPFDGHSIDLGFIESACAELGSNLRCKQTYHTVVIKSTVTPGTTEGLVQRTLEANSGKRAGVDFGLGMNPEFLTEGQAVADFLYPDRIVIGGFDERTLDVMEKLYEPFAGVPVIRTTTSTAEMIKYASNALLANLISFSNEFANLCTALGGIDIVDVLRAVRLSRYLCVPNEKGERVEAPITSFLAAGCGFGGSCLPKDVNALIERAKRSGVRMNLLEAVIKINNSQPLTAVASLRKHIPSLAGRRVVVLGLAFKPDTSDTRESPAFPIIRELLSVGALVRAYDPVATAEFRARLSDGPVEFSSTLREAVEGVDAIILVTRWKQFSEVPELLRSLDPQPIVVDCRRMLQKEEVARYAGVGV